MTETTNIFTSFSGILNLLNACEIEVSDLDKALFFPGCTSSHLNDEIAEDYPQYPGKTVELVRDAVLAALSDGRAWFKRDHLDYPYNGAEIAKAIGPVMALAGITAKIPYSQPDDGYCLYTASLAAWADTFGHDVTVWAFQKVSCSTQDYDYWVSKKLEHLRDHPINVYIKTYGKIDKRMPDHRMCPAVVCKDGFTVSIQASSTHYCEPRCVTDVYESVELGFPSAVVRSWREYCEDWSKPTDTVYGWVPVEKVMSVLRRHGGIDITKTMNKDRERRERQETLSKWYRSTQEACRHYVPYIGLDDKGPRCLKCDGKCEMDDCPGDERIPDLPSSSNAIGVLPMSRYRKALSDGGELFLVGRVRHMRVGGKVLVCARWDSWGGKFEHPTFKDLSEGLGSTRWQQNMATEAIDRANTDPTGLGRRMKNAEDLKRELERAERDTAAAKHRLEILSDQFAEKKAELVELSDLGKGTEALIAEIDRREAEIDSLNGNIEFLEESIPTLKSSLDAVSDLL